MTHTNGHDPVAAAKALDHWRGEKLSFSGWTRDEARVLLRKVGVYIAAQVQPLQKEIADLKAQVAELQQGGVKFSGMHQRANGYRRGEICSYDNSLWVALVDVKPMEIPGKCAAWQLALRGQPDARQPTKGGSRGPPEERRS